LRININEARGVGDSTEIAATATRSAGSGSPVLFAQGHRTTAKTKTTGT
jgi:hypothetical protein